jgi:PPOX class probable F420-dependent enzyme
MRSLVSAARVGRLATASAAGRPHAVPTCFALVGETLYSAIDHKPKRGQRLRRIANIEATGRASLLVDEYAEDWSALWWVRLDGPARVVTDETETREAVAALMEKYRQYARQPPDGPILALDVRVWRGWSAATGAE